MMLETTASRPTARLPGNYSQLSVSNQSVSGTSKHYDFKIKVINVALVGRWLFVLNQKVKIKAPKKSSDGFRLLSHFLNFVSASFVNLPRNHASDITQVIRSSILDYVFFLIIATLVLYHTRKRQILHY